jgi:hypothetical protein
MSELTTQQIKDRIMADTLEVIRRDIKAETSDLNLFPELFGITLTAGMKVTQAAGPVRYILLLACSKAFGVAFDATMANLKEGAYDPRPGMEH